jgi:hypothetical protein
MQTNKCRLFALNKEEPSGFASFKQLPNFQAGIEAPKPTDGRFTAIATDAWQFSKFANLF